MEKERFVRQQVTRRGGGQDQPAEIEQTSKPPAMFFFFSLSLSYQQSIKMPDSVEQGVNKLRDAERRLVPAPDDNSARSSRSKIQSVPRIL
ncbi:hypothetical protein Pyn_16790 [Prunus yedoensis var. nudiflora]|uniref:Uncharacterized protein n=1 Tax=Prunus yedoensis var. nudiflora TaxID=2094558 RepID=A0A314XMU1_PRUYE|nr:hypothetical protein Pyn_16790 [Prunus yedoensis var. nudiflora]